MKIFSLFQSDRRSPAWTYTTHGMIWRILFSDSGRIFGESRDQEQKRVSFFCLDGQTGTPLWEGREFEERWWIGIEAVRDDVALLHEFAKPDLPEHKRIKALEGTTGNLLWKNDELTYWFGYGTTLYAYKDLFEKRVGYALNIRSGEILQTFDDSFEELRRIRSLATDEQRQEAFRFPEILDANSVDPLIEATVRKATAGTRVAGEIEYIREQGYLVFNYHVPEADTGAEAPLFSNRLSVIDMQGNKSVFSAVLAHNVKAFIPDSFFAKLPYVYFIKDQTTLTAVKLWKS